MGCLLFVLGLLKEILYTIKNDEELCFFTEDLKLQL